jgi:hypothetical protein
MLDEAKLDDFLRAVELDFEPVEKPSLAEEGNDAGRVTEAGVEGEPGTADVERDVREVGGNVPRADAAVALAIVRIERQVEVQRNLHGEHAFVRAGVHQRQEIDEAVFVDQADADARPKEAHARWVCRIGSAWFSTIGELHRKAGR